MWTSKNDEDGCVFSKKRSWVSGQYPALIPRLLRGQGIHVEVLMDVIKVFGVRVAQPLLFVVGLMSVLRTFVIVG